MGERIWAYSLDDETMGGTYDTREEAVAAGMRDAGDEYLSVFIHECRPYRPEVDAQTVIESVRDEACQAVGSEIVEYDDWLYGVTEEEEAMLGEMLTGALREWMRLTGNEPGFLLTVGTEEMEVDDG